MGQFLRHIPCPHCGSSDAGSLYDNGTAHCFVCAADWRHGEGEVVTTSTPKNLIPLASQQFLASDKRRLTEATAQKFKYGLYVDEKGQSVQIANYYDADGELVAQKLRYPGKKFLTRGDFSKVGLFGQQLWSNDNGKINRLVITEGEIDAMSVSQLQDNKWPVVSIPTGAQGAKKALAAQLEWLNGFNEIVLMFDNDEAGQTAARDVVDLFPPGKVKVASLALKDANDMLVAGRGGEVVSAIWNAKEVRPDGIVMGDELWARVEAMPENRALDYPWDGLNALTLGSREGEMVMWTAGTGIGKSTILRQIAHDWITNKKERVGFLFLEESVEETTLLLAGLTLKQRLLLKPKGERETAEAKAAWEALAPNVVMYDHFGSTDPENLISKIRFMVKGLGIKTIMVDHISIVISGLEDGGNERVAIDHIMTKFAMLVKELRCRLHVICHLKKPDGTPYEEGGQISMDALRGSGTLKQLSWDIIAGERDQQAEKNANVVRLRVLKCRFTGRTGVAGHIAYDLDTGIYNEVAPEFEVEADTSDKKGDY